MSINCYNLTNKTPEYLISVYSVSNIYHRFIKVSNKQSTTQRKVQINGLYIILALWGVVILHGAWNRATQVAQIPYSQFHAYLSENRVDKVKIDSQTIRGELIEPEVGQPERFVTVRVEPELAEELSGHGVEFAGEVEGGFFAVLMS